MLTEKQKQTVLDSLWVVNTALKLQGLSNDEDMRQDAILYLCGCIDKYDETRGAKWTTYAFKTVYFFIKRQKERRHFTIDEVLPLEEAYNIEVQTDLYSAIDDVRDTLLKKYGEDCATTFDCIMGGIPKKQISALRRIKHIDVDLYLGIIKSEVENVLSPN